MSGAGHHPFPAAAATPARRREAAGRPLLAGFLARATAALGRPIAAYDLVDLPTTDNLADEFAGKVESCLGGETPHLRKSLAPAELPHIAQRLTGLPDSDPDRPVMLFRRESEFCGAIVTTLESVVTRLAPLLEAEGSVWIGSKDMSDGLRITSAAPGAFEVIVWGGNWLPPVTR